MNDLTADKLAIRETVENWVMWRDAGDWEHFATVWHEDGWMTATWFQGPATHFIEASREGFNRGVNILHTLGGWTCEIAGARHLASQNDNPSARAAGRRSGGCSMTGPLLRLFRKARRPLGDCPAAAHL